MGILFLIYTIFLFLGLAGSFAIVRDPRLRFRPFMGWLAGIVLMLIIFAASAKGMLGWPKSPEDWRALYDATIAIQWIYLLAAPIVCIGIFEVVSRVDQETGLALSAMIFSFIFSYALIHTFFIRTHPDVSFSASMGLVFGGLIYLAFFNKPEKRQPQPREFDQGFG